jgi:hypothetical protein
MDETILRSRVLELVESLSASPAKQARASQAYAPEHVNLHASRSMEDLLDHLRLQVKYVVFDLEATRRENSYLRNMLERRTNTGESGGEQF